MEVYEQSHPLVLDFIVHHHKRMGKLGSATEPQEQASEEFPSQAVQTVAEAFEKMLCWLLTNNFDNIDQLSQGRS